MKRVRTTSSSTQHIPASTSPEQVTKYAVLDEKPQPGKSVKCFLPPHEPKSFDSLAEYEAHYTAQHSHRCAECGINLPSARFLQLHLDEHHDPFVAIKRDADEKTFKCFVEDCEKVCRDWKKRRMHLVDKHGYPRNFDFLVVENGIDGRSSLLRRGVDEHGHRKSSRERAKDDAESNLTTSDNVSVAMSDVAKDAAETAATTKSQKPENVPADTAMDDISASMAALKIPEHISFGRRKGKSGFSKS